MKSDLEKNYYSLEIRTSQIQNADRADCRLECGAERGLITAAEITRNPDNHGSTTLEDTLSFLDEAKHIHIMCCNLYHLVCHKVTSAYVHISIWKFTAALLICLNGKATEIPFNGRIGMVDIFSGIIFGDKK